MLLLASCRCPVQEFTLAKDELQRRRGADIIAANPSAYDPGTGGLASPTSYVPTLPAGAAQQGQGQGVDWSAASGSSVDMTGAAAGADGDGDEVRYRPKVSTWGMFERPANISEAYGGGRNIRPGQELETPEQKAAREAAYAQALKAGLRTGGAPRGAGGGAGVCVCVLDTGGQCPWWFQGGSGVAFRVGAVRERGWATLYVCLTGRSVQHLLRCSQPLWPGLGRSFCSRRPLTHHGLLQEGVEVAAECGVWCMSS